VDDRVNGADRALEKLYAHTGNASIIGVTGNPGSGKSTLVDQLIGAFRSANQKVGVVAVDPSSPYSGGAILGDRIRMMDHATDEGVFIRSMATRGQLGGLSRSTDDVVNILDAMGYDKILIETVGVGQDEIDIVRSAQTSIVVMVPGMGDDIQAIKAGILEIADIFVVNKADRDGVGRTMADLKHLRTLASTHPEWEAPILKTVAPAGQGIEELVETIGLHQDWLKQSGQIDNSSRGREANLLNNIVRDRLHVRAEAAMTEGNLGESLINQLIERTTTPYAAASKVIDKIFGK
jgi:LAO/AO transport system kinase